MKRDTSPLVATAALAFASVLSGTLLIPVVRPLMHWAAPGSESASHAFMALNLLGGVVAAPFVARLASRVASPSALVARLALADGALLLLIASRPPIAMLLAIRTLQGALRDAAEPRLLWLMPILGLASAAIFASAMREAARSADSQSRVTAMSALNSAGNLGVLLGTALAGVVSALLRSGGHGAHSTHSLVFGIGGAVPLVVATLTFCALLVAPRASRPVRARS